MPPVPRSRRKLPCEETPEQAHPQGSGAVVPSGRKRASPFCRFCPRPLPFRRIRKRHDRRRLVLSYARQHQRQSPDLHIESYRKGRIHPLEFFLTRDSGQTCPTGHAPPVPDYNGGEAGGTMAPALRRHPHHQPEPEKGWPDDGPVLPLDPDRGPPLMEHATTRD